MKNKRNKRRYKNPNVYPPGWNYKKAMGIAKYFDDRKDVDFVGDAQLPQAENLPVWVEVPQALLPEVRKLIARHRKSA